MVAAVSPLSSPSRMLGPQFLPGGRKEVPGSPSAPSIPPFCRDVPASLEAVVRGGYLTRRIPPPCGAEKGPSWEGAWLGRTEHAGPHAWWRWESREGPSGQHGGTPGRWERAAGRAENNDPPDVGFFCFPPRLPKDSPEPTRG